MSWLELIENTLKEPNIREQWEPFYKTIPRYMTPMECLADIQLEYIGMEYYVDNNGIKTLRGIYKHFMEALGNDDSREECIREIAVMAYISNNDGVRLFSAYLKWPQYFNVYDLARKLKPYLGYDLIEDFLFEKVDYPEEIKHIIQEYIVPPEYLASFIFSKLKKIAIINHALFYFRYWFTISETTFYTNLPDLIIKTLHNKYACIPKEMGEEVMTPLRERLMDPKTYSRYKVFYYPKANVIIDDDVLGRIDELPDDEDMSQFLYSESILETESGSTWETIPEGQFLRYILTGSTR